MSKFYTRAERRAYRDKRRAQAALVADRLMGKKKETLFQPDDGWKWQPLKSRQIGMSLYSILLTDRARWSAIITGIEGV